MLTRYVGNGMKYRKPLFTLPDLTASMDEAMDELFGAYTNTVKRSYRATHTDVGLELSVDVPGVKREDVDLFAKGNLLTVEYTLRGEKKTLSYSVDSVYDLTKATSKVADGVLDIIVPRAGPSNDGRIKIEVK